MSAFGSENRNETLRLKEEIKALKNKLQKVIENQIEIKQNISKFTKSINEDSFGLKKDFRLSDKQNTPFERTQASTQEYEVPLLQAAKVGNTE